MPTSASAVSLYLLRAERRDRALTIADNGRTGILSWALVLNESMRVAGQTLLFAAGIVSLATPNQTAPASLVAPLMPVTLMLFATIAVAQSIVLIYARQRIARYPITELAQQETLLDVQRDVAKVGVKVGEAKRAADQAAAGVTKKIADLAKRANTSEKRADVAEGRADVAEGRADTAERRADAAEEREG